MTRRGPLSGQGLAEDRAQALRLTPVSRETLARLDTFVALLREWQPRVNLVGPSTLESIWTRHIADSLQLIPLAPEARIWVDLGSGGGFPGLVIAMALADDSAVTVHLVESNGKKAAFLREAAHITNTPVQIHAVRIEDFVDKLRETPQIVTARALAPLEELLAKAYPLLKRGAVGLFPKGQNVDAELTAAAKCWKIQATLVPSVTDPTARIVVVRKLEPTTERGRDKPSTRTGGRMLSP